jgi:hypothetical protein
VTGAATIVGAGPKATTVNGKGIDRVFSIGIGGRTVPAPYALRNMAVVGGLTAENGGGLYLSVQAKTRLSRLLVKRNAASTGGGLYSRSRDLRIDRSTIAGNQASGFGGGVFMPAGDTRASALIRASTISNNGAALGGGLAAYGSPPGGTDEPPSADIVNSTFAGNHVDVSGGGLSAIFEAGIVLDNSTVAYNQADADNSGGGAGGGMHQSTDADVQIKDIIVAQNTVGSSGLGPNCAGQFLGGGLIAGSTAGCTIGGTFVADAMIGPLASNGGPTKTIALLPGSPAIDRPNPFDCPARDQRGRKRDASCDTGSFERKPTDP